jgi:uncharacterized protein (DUF433 family)
MVSSSFSIISRMRVMLDKGMLIAALIRTAKTPDRRYQAWKKLPIRQERKQMSELNRITIDPKLCGGRPCIRHMRIKVKDILDLLASGASTDEILEDYPYLEVDDIRASLEYAAHLLERPVLSAA